jgi:PAS domain S-box-containing protein
MGDGLTLLDTRRLAAIIEASSDLVGLTGPNGETWFLNLAGRRLLGFGENEDLSRLKIEDYHSADAGRLVRDEAMPAALAQGVTTFENTFRHRSGRNIPVSQMLIAHRDATGKLECFSTVARDISEQKEAEESLRASEERFRLLLDDLHVGVLVQDAEARILVSNPKALELLGLTKDQLLGRTSFDPTWNVVHEDGSDFQADEHPVPLAVRTSKPVRNVTMGVFRPTRKDRVWLLVNAEPQRRPDGTVRRVVCTFSDITDRKKLEESLLQSQKLEAVGRLAGGIAHDFNNLLTVIMGYVEDIAGTLSPGTREHNELTVALEASQRAAGLTRQLLAFARRHVIAPKLVDLNEVVQDIERMLRRLIGEQIDLRRHEATGLWPVKVDRTQIEQVILNLAVNARDAMPDAGVLTIETGNVVLGDEYAAAHAGVTPGEYVMLAVSDTGTGIPRELQPHIFEPFFTTKGPLRGTGLGLATVHGIVKQHGGHIWLYSEPASGTAFKIYLPRATTGDVEAVPLKTLLKPRVRGGETLLLVEDEELVRSYALRVLERGGYQVLSAADPLEALKLAEAHRGTISLLVTDVIMPHMSGQKLATELTEQRPELRILFVSGYTENTIAHHGVLEPDVAFLPKPYTPTDLLQRVREVLDEGASS